MKRLFTLGLIFISFLGNSQTMTFEGLNLPLDSFWNGSDLSGSYKEGFGSSDSFIALNQYDTSFGGYWSGGIAVSTMTDDSTGGFSNLYGSITGSGYNSNSYGVVNTSGTSLIYLGWGESPESRSFASAYITNSTFAYLSMMNGDAFAKKFGGIEGTDPDYFFIRFSIYQGGNKEDLDFYLADLRSLDSGDDYILNDWTFVDLSAFGSASDSIEMSLFSSDTGAFGMNTPSFFCIDDLMISQVTGIANIESDQKTIQLTVQNDGILANSESITNFQFINMRGELISSKLETTSAYFDTSSLSKGIYIIRSSNKSGEQSTKVWRW